MAEASDDDRSDRPGEGPTWPCVVGVVEHGRHLGRTIGFPTANVRPGEEADGTPDGVYASWLVRADGSVLPGAASIGVRPTVESDGERLLEVHVIDADHWLELYDEEVSVHLVRAIRPEQRFDGLEALKAQIRRDCDAVRDLLATSPPPPTAA